MQVRGEGVNAGVCCIDDYIRAVYELLILDGFNVIYCWKMDLKVNEIFLLFQAASEASLKNIIFEYSLV